MRTTLNVPINFQKQNPKFLFVAFLPQSLFALSIAPSGSSSPHGGARPGLSGGGSGTARPGHLPGALGTSWTGLQIFGIFAAKRWELLWCAEVAEQTRSSGGRPLRAPFS